jgi:hypothetical protein
MITNSYHTMRVYIWNLHTLLHQIDRKKAVNNQSGTAKDMGRELKPSNSARPGSYAQLNIDMQNNPLRPTTNCNNSPTNKLKEHLTGLLGALVGLPEHQTMRLQSFIQNLHIMHIQNIREISLVQCCLPAHQGLAETQLEQHWNTKLADPLWEVLMTHTCSLQQEVHTHILWPWTHH